MPQLQRGANANGQTPSLWQRQTIAAQTKASSPMRVTILVILYSGTTAITVHDSENSASSFLMEFMKVRWFERFGENFISTSLSPDECARRFFADDDSTHILVDRFRRMVPRSLAELRHFQQHFRDSFVANYPLGEADLSEIEAQIDPMLRT